MSKPVFRLVGIEPMQGYRLRLCYADGQTWMADISEWISESRALSRLKNIRLFNQAKVSEQGTHVEWIPDELELAADNLRNLAVEQAGGIGHERIWGWLHDNGLTLEQGAEALGISRRMLIYYRDGEKPIPRSIWLACLGWNAVLPKGNTLPRTIPTPKEYAALHR